MRIVLREMILEDIDQVINIENESFSIPWSKEALEKEVSKNELAIYLVAEVEEKVAGYGGFWKILDEAHITNIAVKDKFRGKGIGDAILMGIVDYCDTNDIPYITLEVRSSNIVAQNLYKKYDFKVEGVRPRYYTDNNEDAIIMWRNKESR
ncbi:MAG: ribosomal protein S18-alanine N-acetyltransferase [Gudongella sp.]|nr:ribosomal protein S18-alanine N-acetyltransferase [Gudongella sp.]